MSYEIVKTIEGKKRGFKFSLLTIQHFSDYTGIEFGDVMDEMKKRVLESLVVMLWCANTVYEKGKNGKISKYDVDDWIMKMEQEDLQDIYNCFGEFSKSLVDRLPKGDTKKK